METSIPPALWNERAENTLLVSLYPSYKGTHGILLGPIQIMPNDRAHWISRLLTAQTVILPLVSSIFITLVGFITVLVAQKAQLSKEKPIRFFVAYCITMALYLLSLTRLPREFLPAQLGVLLHFSLREWTEFFHLGLILSVFRIKHRLLSFFVGWHLLLGALLLVAAISIALGWVAPPFQTLYGILRSTFIQCVPLYIIPAALSIIVGFKRWQSDRRTRLLPLLYTLVIGMIVSDYLALSGRIQDLYFVRFYPTLIALAFCHVLWEHYAKIRQIALIERKTGELISQFAHDLRTPISALKAAAAMESLPDDARKILKQATDRISNIAKDVLEPLKKSSDRKSVDKRKISGNELLRIISQSIDDSKKDLQPTRGVSFVVSPADNATLNTFINIESSDQLYRVFSNLITNSIDAIPDGGVINVSMQSDRNCLEILISDNGCGIPTEQLPNLFEKGATYGKKEGTGLGLYFCRSAIEAWGGTIHLVSSPGKGTTVKIRLPRF